MHLQEVGREYGTTTGRRRRCGWLDLVVMKHSCLINGYDALNLTKLDVLDDLDEIKVAVKYLIDEREIPGFPGEFCRGNRTEHGALISHQQRTSSSWPRLRWFMSLCRVGSSRSPRPGRWKNCPTIAKSTSGSSKSSWEFP